MLLLDNAIKGVHFFCAQITRWINQIKAYLRLDLF